MTYSVYPIYGDPLQTVRVAVSDTAKSLTTLGVTLLQDGKYPVGGVITCEAYAVRVGFISAPTNTGSKIGHKVSVGDSIRMASREYVENMLIINDAPGSAGVLQVTLEY